MKKLICPECVKCAFRKKWCVICKKVVLLALAAVMMAGCEKIVETDYHTKEGLMVCVIDSCEYIHYSNGWGPEYTHKGNCRFCKERRQKELEELVIKLKEK